MRIAALSFYADFARFYGLLAAELRTLGGEVNLQILSQFPSSQAFAICHGLSSVFLPMAVRFENGDGGSVGAGKLDMRYHQRILLDNFDPRYFERLSVQYLNYFDKYLAENNPDVVIIAGDSRLCSVALKEACSQRNISCLFFEQGPNNTTILDPHGVNANCSFRFRLDSGSSRKKLKGTSRVASPKWRGYKKYRVLDYVSEALGLGRFWLENLGGNTPLFKGGRPPDHAKRPLDVEPLSLSQKRFLLILQVPLDANMTNHSPHFENHFQMVRDVSLALPKNTSLVVREHPLYRGLYESEIYEFISDAANVAWSAGGCLEKDIAGSDVVIVNNSTVGVEAMVMGKTVLVLGNAYYDQGGACMKYDGGGLDALLLHAVTNPVDQAKIAKKVNGLFADWLIPGHFRESEQKSVSLIAERLHQYVTENSVGN